MRVSALIIASAHANANHSHRLRRQAEGDDRRYFQLVDMMENYNPSFDERKYWAYGCNCLILGKFDCLPIGIIRLRQFQPIFSPKMARLSQKWLIFAQK